MCSDGSAMGRRSDRRLPFGRLIKMQVATDYMQGSRRMRGERTVIPGLVLMGLTLIVALFAVLISSDSFASYPYLFLLPWIFGLGVLMAVPSVILYYQGKFSFADPLVFFTFSYLFPAFVIGGLFFAVGWSQPSFMSLIQDADYNLPFSVVLIGLGFAGLAAGYLVPAGAKIGSFIANFLPHANYPLRSFVLPGLLLLIVGVMNTVAAFALGLFGFQKADEISSYDGLIYLTTLFWMQASFLLWYLVFCQKKLTFFYVPIIFLLVTTALSRAIFAGNRGSIIQIASIVILAYILAGRRFKMKQSIIAGSILIVGLIVGMIYGTTFRAVKGTEARQSADQYAENIVQTFDSVGRSDYGENLRFGFTSLTERVDLLSTVAVVVSNYEQLAPYEEAYGLDKNIWSDTTTFWIPRVIWTDKPSASDPRKFSDLYFNYGESSFAITPVGDLLRNYGVIGIPIGMFILGFLLRIIYRALVDGQIPTVWRLTLYFMLLTSVSLEGFYGTIIPNLFKVGFTAIVGILLVNLIARKMDSNNLALR